MEKFGPLYPTRITDSEYTFKASSTGTQTLNIEVATFGIYKCDRCGRQTTSLNEKGHTPLESYNHNCNPLWFIKRRSRGIYRLVKTVG